MAARPAVVLIVSLFVGFGAPPGWEQNDAKPPAVDPQALCAKLREGDWSVEDFLRLIDALKREGCTIAADWWTTAAEEALAAGRLPPKAKSALARIRKKVKALNAPNKKVRSLWSRAGQHTRAMISKKAPKEATAASEVAESLARHTASVGWTRRVASLRKRVQAISDDSGDAKIRQRDRQATTKLTAALILEVAERSARAFHEFQRFGCGPGFLAIESLLRTRLPGGKVSAEVRKFRAAARRFGLARELNVQILGSDFRVRVHQDGVATSIGSKSEDGFFSASEWRELRIPVLPGEILA